VHHAAFDTKLFSEVFVTLLVIMDPIGTVPLFLALTSGRSRRARRSLSWPSSCRCP
jgi:multiple antibiotic resistance protein